MQIRLESSAVFWGFYFFHHLPIRFYAFWKEVSASDSYFVVVVVAANKCFLKRN